MKRMKEKYSHFVLLLYFPVYLLAFWFVENFGASKIHIIECALDHEIPFIEYFIVPYLLWFVYIAVGVAYFLFWEKSSFKDFMYLGMIGMTIFIIVSIIYPNGLQLRPTYFVHDNIFVDLTKMIYGMDTPTNVFPSIHVYNSLAMNCVINRSEKLQKYRAIQTGSLILCVLIIMSTMFLKQHSVFDVISGTILFCGAHMLVYNTNSMRAGVPQHAQHGYSSVKR